MDEFDEIAFRLAEPDWDPDGSGMCVTPATLAVAMRDALRDAGLVDVSLTGVAGRVRRRGRAVMFEVTETLPGDAEPLAVVPVVSFGNSIGTRGGLADGALVRVSGYLEWKPDWGCLRVVAQDCQIDRTS